MHAWFTHDRLSSLSNRAAQMDVLSVLKQRVADGVCTDQDLEGVGNTLAPAQQCADGRDKCDTLITVGGMSCETDFCPTCTNAGQCDLSCDLCSGKRRAQTGPTCSPTEFQDQAQSVTDACCDPGKSNTTPRI